MRVTTGRFVLSGKTFRHTDTWTNRTNAHRTLEDYWVGTTEFYLVSSRAPSCSFNSTTPNDGRQDEQQHTQNHDNDQPQNEQRNITIKTHTVISRAEKIGGEDERSGDRRREIIQ